MPIPDVSISVTEKAIRQRPSFACSPRPTFLPQPAPPEIASTLAGFLAAAHPKGAKLDDGAPCPRRI